MDKIKIVLADDHEIFRDGFRVMVKKIPHIELVAEAADGAQLIEVCETHLPNVIVTDIKMPRMDGIEATRKLVNLFPDIGIIALSMFDEENLIVDMLEAGARGYLLKNASKEEIVNAVTSVNMGRTYYCENTSAKLTQMIATSNYNPHKKTVKPVFSEKELTVMRLICREFSNKEIGEQLNLSKRTVEGYREKILEKINAKNTVGIVVYAIKHKIFTDSL